MPSDSAPVVFASRALPGDALERLGRATRLTVWSGPGAPDADALRAGATSQVDHATFISQPCVQCHNQISWTLNPFLRRRF